VPSPPAPSPPDAANAEPDRARRVLVAVTAGIAAYKTCHVVSRLAQQGLDVRVVMTPDATRFVGPVTLQALSGRPVLASTWDADTDPASQHVGLARWCDLMLIAPATANCLAKLAHGLTDDLVALTANALPGSDRPGGTPLLVAPAMNADMWANPLTQRNLQTLHDLLPNLTQLGPDDGWQACRTAGPGRMLDPDAIVDAVMARFNTPGRQDARTPSA
jgi:phosphopantothenoylcysteine decarboxylase/phosphopantothenate--cysteine ligase